MKINFIKYVNLEEDCSYTVLGSMCLTLACHPHHTSTPNQQHGNHLFSFFDFLTQTSNLKFQKEEI